VSDSAIIWFRGFRKLALAMGLGALEPPPLGCTGFEPVLTRLLNVADARVRARRRTKCR
jgi:hypothetical protein